MAADKLPLDPKQDLAAYEVVGSRGTFQLWIGGTPVITDSAKSNVASLPIYSLAALVNGLVVAFVPGTHTAAQAVITAVQIDAVGQDVPYWDSGKFNHESVNFPAAWNTYALRKSGLIGSMGLRVGHLI